MAGCNGRPCLSIVVSTYFRHYILRRALESLVAAALSRPDISVEVIVVVDPGDVDARDVVEDVLGGGPANLSYRLVELDANSVSRARNIGIHASSSDVVAVVDDDVVFDPDSIDKALTHINSDERVVAVGFPVISLNPSLDEKLHYWKFVGVVDRNAYTVMPVTFFHRERLMNIGMYREDLGPPLSIHEDWELGSRIRKHGYLVVIDGRVPQLHLLHLRRSGQNMDTSLRVDAPASSKATRGFRRLIYYVRGYVEKNWWSFFEVLKSSPHRQLLEYTAYYLAPIVYIALAIVDPGLFTALILAGIVYIEASNLYKGYYRELNAKERLAYPLVLVMVRIIRAYSALAGYIKNKITRKTR